MLWDTGDKRKGTSAMLCAPKESMLGSGLILTEDFEGEERIEGRTIIYKPLWKWLLKI